MNQDDFDDLERSFEESENEVERLVEELADARAIIESLQNKLDAIEELL